MNLTGKTTAGGWLIGERVEFPADHTSGKYSDCFYVSKDGQRAFLKALNIARFELSQLADVLSGFDYEGMLLNNCRKERLNRVVQILDSGRIEHDPTQIPILRYVPFLVLELAQGDIRSTIDVSDIVEDSWRFQVLHQTTAALLQLHKKAIAHQDLKPSNVLTFDGGVLKLGDLGCSSQQGQPAPHDRAATPGAFAYAPFEQRYGYLSPDWIERRISTDVFHLGCLVVFAFTNMCFPMAVMSKLAEPYQPKNWGDSYLSVAPHVLAAALETLSDISMDFPQLYRAEITEIVKELCHPMPSERGKPRGVSITTPNRLWLERYVSRFDILMKKATIKRAQSTA